MKHQNRILMVSAGAVILLILAVALFTDSWWGNGFCLMAGFMGMCIGGGCIGVALALRLLKNNRYAKGFILSGIILFLAGLTLLKFLPQY